MNRWQGWAQQLRARHDHTASGRHAGPMVLLHAHGTAPAAVHRHLHAQLHLQLQPHFAAQFFSRHLATVPRAAFDADGTVRAAAPVRPSLVRYLPVPAQPAAGQPSVVTAPRADAAPVGHLPAAPAAALVRSPGIGMRRLLAASQSGARVAPAVTRDHTAMRVRRQAVRHESVAPAPGAVLAKAPRAAAAPAIAAATEQLRMQLELARVVPAPAAPAINVESLAGMVIEQIDRRMLAWRERMGRG